MRYKAVVEVFFQITFKWSKWCAQTLHPFSQILPVITIATEKKYWSKPTVMYTAVSRRKALKERLISRVNTGNGYSNENCKIVVTRHDKNCFRLCVLTGQH